MNAPPHYEEFWRSAVAFAGTRRALSAVVCGPKQVVPHVD